jgi:hypothetical protein
MHVSQPKWDGRRPPPLAICASAWLEQRARKGFGYPATCAVVNGERRFRTLKRGTDFRSRSVEGTADMFWEPPRRATSFIRLFQNA